MRWGFGKVTTLSVAFVARQGLSTIAAPQGCDEVQVVAFSIGPHMSFDITRSDRQIGNVSVTIVGCSGAKSTFDFIFP